jgi:hypothetical protein
MDHGGGRDVSKEAEPAPAPEVINEIRAVVHRAKQGDVSVLPRLRELLAEFPLLAERYGNLAAQAEAGWAALVAGPNLYLRECLLHKAAAMRVELGGPSPSPVERLLVERVVATWMQLNYFDALEPVAIDGGESPRLAQYRARRQEQAHRAYLSALAALTTLRRLLPPAIINAVPTTGAEIIQADGSNGYSGPERYGRSNGQADLLLGVHIRMTGLFEQPVGVTGPGQTKMEPCEAES